MRSPSRPPLGAGPALAPARRGFRHAGLAVVVAASLCGPGTAGASADVAVGTAGDVACDPASGSFRGGRGTETECRMADTADLLGDVQAVLGLGDLQYTEGTLDQFVRSYARSWGRLADHTYPVPGNHEYRTPAAAGYFDYFGDAAGDRDRGYYSFDLGAWHLIALNSNCAPVGGCGRGSPQELWLRTDLLLHPARCTLAFWHHPRFFSGSPSTGRRFRPFWQALSDAGVEIVLNGHRHNYERFAPMTPDGAPAPGTGIREFIVGTGGVSLARFDGRRLPTTKKRQRRAFGVLRLTLQDEGYDWRFLGVPGSRPFADSGRANCH